MDTQRLTSREFLLDVADTVENRHKEYGSPIEDFQDVADYWNIYIRRTLKKKIADFMEETKINITNLTPQAAMRVEDRRMILLRFISNIEVLKATDAMVLMELLKVSRWAGGYPSPTYDTARDGAGYWACIAEKLFEKEVK